jgi:hypothetical protein
MRKVSEYRQQADECRRLLGTARTPEHREMLAGMVATWERLADERARQGFKAVVPPMPDAASAGA